LLPLIAFSAASGSKLDVPWRVPNQNVGGACCDEIMTKRHRRGRQGSQRSLIPIPTTSPPGDPQKISNRYTEEVRWEILLLEPVNDWFLGLCKNAPAVADKVEQAIDV
jgi:hypothetical protein